MIKNLVTGIIAPVDAGKTTLIEAILYKNGQIRTKGRVDHGDAFLDTEEVEKKRGITVYSKTARINLGEKNITIIDTPGHRDFSAEMERSLGLLDYAILVINARDMVTGYVKLLIRLIIKAKLPFFVFINKMDQLGADLEMVINELSASFDLGFLNMRSENLAEEIVFSCDSFLDKFEKGIEISSRDVAEKIRDRRIIPVYSGSALHFEGIDEFLEGIEKYMLPTKEKESFSARVGKIKRDQNDRLTYVKITGGSVKVRDEVLDGEKVTKIRIYDGEGYKNINEATSGMYVALLGLKSTRAGDALGDEVWDQTMFLNPLMTSRVLFDDSVHFSEVSKTLKEIEEELPEIHVREEKENLNIDIMGEIQKDILKDEVKKRLGANISFGKEVVLYKETVKEEVIGVGHFEPLRHYAEVHIKITPLERGEGIVYENGLSNSNLPINFQNQIISHLKAKIHKGVLIGAPLTDVKFTLVAGVSSSKHTSGGDFREATLRAVRQGLMESESIILEPVVSFNIVLPKENIGRVISDLSNMDAKLDEPKHMDDLGEISGRIYLSRLENYGHDLAVITGGAGHMSIIPDGYEEVKDQKEILKNSNYDPESDIENPSGSVFCAHGAGFFVPWYDVKEYMNAKGGAAKEEKKINYSYKEVNAKYENEENELKAIFERTFGKREPKSSRFKKKKTKEFKTTSYKESSHKSSGKNYLLVDGYNIIFGWDKLNALAKDNIEAARGKLMDICADYEGAMGKNHELILVFDAYKVVGGKGDVFKYKGIYVVYTKEAETADAYIERAVHDMNKGYSVKVATSDALEQRIVLGAGASRMSAREFQEEILLKKKEILEIIEREGVKRVGSSIGDLIKK